MSLNRAQRVAIVVAYAAVLFAAWQWYELGGWKWAFGSDEGWMNWNREALMAPGEVHGRLWVQVGFVVAWILPSLWILRDRGTSQAYISDPDPE